MFLSSFDALTTQQDVGYALATSKFCLAMLVINMFVKVSLSHNFISHA
jgi:hypothetical protein